MHRILFVAINVLTVIFESEGATLQQQLAHLGRRRQQSKNLIDNFRRAESDESNDEDALLRSDPRARGFFDQKTESTSQRKRGSHKRYYNSAPKRKHGRHLRHNRRSLFQYDQNGVGPIIGAPSMPSHLPQAEPILPGHTLLRPAMGMLKSSVKFPHRELEDGAGVYGNIKNLGIKYDGKNERVLYTGFRRRSPIGRRINYIPVELDSNEDDTFSTPRFNLKNLILDMDRNNIFHNGKTLGAWDSTKNPIDNKLILYIMDPSTGTLYFTDLFKSNEKYKKINYNYAQEDDRNILEMNSNEAQTERSAEIYKVGSRYFRELSKTAESFEYEGPKKWFNEAGQDLQDLAYEAWKKMQNLFG